MDFKKIIKGSKIPIVISFVIFLTSLFLSFVYRNGTVTIRQVSIAELGMFVIAFYLGYRGANKFKFGYADAAVGGVFLAFISFALSYLQSSDKLAALTFSLGNEFVYPPFSISLYIIWFVMLALLGVAASEKKL